MTLLPALTPRSRILALALFATMVLVGCYSFSATSLPSHIKSIEIADVENLTTDMDLGLRLRDGMVKMFEREASGVRQVPSDGSASFALTLKQYTNGPDNYSRDATVETYKATLVVDVTFYDKIKDKVIYQGKNLRAEGVYDVLKNESEEFHGKTRAIEKLQELIINNALTQW